MHPRCLLFLVAAGLALAAQSVPEVASTAKDRTALGITIYHNNLAMVRDARRIELPAGKVRLAFADVAASIRPKSAWMTFKGVPPEVLERNFEFDLLSPASLVRHSLGEAAGFRPHAGSELRWGELASLPLLKPRWAPWRTPLQRLARIGPVLQPADPSVLVRTEDGYDTQPGSALAFRAAPKQLRASPTLLADLASPQTGPQELELAYTAEKLSWEATYLARLSPSGHSMDLEGFVTLTNGSGTDFPEAILQLVAGEPNVVADPAPMDPDEPRLDSCVVECVATATAPAFKEERLADYLLLTLDRPTSLSNGQTKQVKLFEAQDIPVARTFLFTWTPELRWFQTPPTRATAPSPWVPGSEDHQSWALRTAGLDPREPTSWERCPWVHTLEAPREVPPMDPLPEAPRLLLEFKNDRGSNLGRPLPKGPIWFSTTTPEGIEIPMGSDLLDATPPGDCALIPAPEAWLGAGLRGSHRWRSIRWRRHWMELEGESILSNPRSEPASILLRVMLPEGAEIRSSSAPHTRFQPDCFDFRTTLPPNSESTLHFVARIPREALPFTY